MDKPTIYILPVTTEKEILHAEKRQREVYENYDSVVVTTHGMHSVKITCTNKKSCVECGVVLDALERMSGTRCIPCCNKIIKA